MKIRIEYPTNQANAAVIEVETDDKDVYESDRLQHAADALNMALKTVWGDKAVLVKRDAYKQHVAEHGKEHAVPHEVDGVIAITVDKDLLAALTKHVDKNGRPLFMVVSTTSGDKLVLATEGQSKWHMDRPGK